MNVYMMRKQKEGNICYLKNPYIVLKKAAVSLSSGSYIHSVGFLCRIFVLPLLPFTILWLYAFSGYSTIISFLYDFRVTYLCEKSWCWTGIGFLHVYLLYLRIYVTKRRWHAVTNCWTPASQTKLFSIMMDDGSVVRFVFLSFAYIESVGDQQHPCVICSLLFIFCSIISYSNQAYLEVVLWSD